MVCHVSSLPSFRWKIFRWVPNTVFYGSNSLLVKPMADTLERLKVLINSSTPIVVMETVEEMRAVGLIRAACAELNIAVFEWTIADGLVRSGNNTPAVPSLQARINTARHAIDS